MRGGEKKLLPGVSVRLLFERDPVYECGTESERQRQSGAGRCSQRVHVGGGTRRGTETSEWRCESVCERTDRSGDGQRGDARTRRCHRLEGLSCAREVAPLTETAAPSLSTTIG